ncbi:S9 family peptidase [Massilia sp. Dwa41.01b]|uniref:S9 family peptidase n=1 Tax=unclassified Massilia TaxID=2609279 RepID=UPI0016008965|nr:MULTISPECIES: S9 family peptidase [unclassified Massilia]QNA88168.1 S9 family peptidase [Massilia sp. Dwa41.01b]QNA99074.1 S9 family peptidase [Massilia sp. Se16.2.3]
MISKNNLIRTLLAASLFGPALGVLAADADTPVPTVHVNGARQIPIADFFKKPQFGGQPILSPDGKNMAVLTPRNGRFVLAVIDLATRQPKVVASDPDWNISSPMWVNNNRLVFGISKGSDETMENNDGGGGLYAVDRDGSHFRKLSASLQEARAANVPFKPVSVLQRAGGDSNDLFVVDNARGRDAAVGATDLFRLDTGTGRRSLLTFDNPGNVNEWVLDHANVVRVGTALTVEAGTKRLIQTVFYRDGDKSAWKPIHTAYVNEGKDMSVLGFDFDNKTMLVAGRFDGRDKSAVYVWDFANGKPGELVAEHPTVDITGELLYDEPRKKIIGIGFESMIQEKYYFDADYAKMQATLDASLPGQQVSFSWRGDHVVAVAYSAAQPGQIYFFDTAKKVLEPVFSMMPQFDNKTLAAQTVINYAARDGLNIPAYLTLPQGQAAKGLPLVAYIHGGPHARDHAGFDPTTQMLASRGYAVLQPQFRMSTGFGWKHFTAGWKQWGMAMQDDITDGVAALVKQGIVDPNRVCIIGASYGGYATMYGLAKDPDLYKCGVNWVGVTDISLLFSVSYSDTSNSPVMDDLGVRMHGDPKLDQAYMKERSALENVGKIKAPVLMAYGSEDVRVPLVHGERMRDLLRKKGNEVEWMVMTGEGHGWAKESNRIKFGEAMMSFIDRHIGPEAVAKKK